MVEYRLEGIYTLSLLKNEQYLDDLASEMPSREIAKKWGLGSKTTVTNHRKKIKQRQKEGVVSSKSSSDGSFESTIKHSQELTYEDAERWLRNSGKDPEDFHLTVTSNAYGNGFWSNRISARPKTGKDVRTVPLLSKTEVEKIFSGFKPRVFKDARTGTAVLNMADLQIGKTSAGIGSDVTIPKALNAIAKFRSYVLESKPAEVVLVDNGDPVEGIHNISNKQLTTNDLDLVDQVTAVRRLFLEAIKAVADIVPSVKFVSVPSNHGEVRIARGQAVGSIHNDWGIEINRQLEDAVSLAGIETVEFIIPERHEDTAVVETSGTVLAFHHGHNAGNPNTLGKWIAGQDHGRREGWDADIWVFGHWHSLRVEQTGNGRWLIVASSSDPGSDWFSRKTGESALQGMTAFDVLYGQWSNLRIL